MNQGCIKAGLYQEQDPVTVLLQSRGIPVGNYTLSGTRIIVGGRVQLDKCELVYRVEPDDTVIIIFYGRQGKVSGLRNSFRDLVGFCGLVADRISSIRYIKGKAEPLLAGIDDGICKDRLLAMYRRYLDIEPRNGWLYFNLDDYRKQQAIREQSLQWINRVLKRNNRVL